MGILPHLVPIAWPGELTELQPLQGLSPLHPWGMRGTLTYASRIITIILAMSKTGTKKENVCAISEPCNLSLWQNTF